jgi:hypothetical protein
MCVMRYVYMRYEKALHDIMSIKLDSQSTSRRAVKFNTLDLRPIKTLCDLDLLIEHIVVLGATAFATPGSAISHRIDDQVCLNDRRVFTARRWELQRELQQANPHLSQASPAHRWTC